MPIPSLPTELLREVILNYLVVVLPQSNREDVRSIASKPDWKLVEPLSSSSRTLRHLTLEAWFETYIAKRPSDLLCLDYFPHMIARATELRCIDREDTRRDEEFQWNLRNLWKVRSLRLDVDPLDYGYNIHFLNVPPVLCVLEIHDHPSPSPKVMQEIARTFPALRTLKLSQNAIWCGLCNTCNVASFKEAPVSPVIYKGGMGLPKHYNIFLEPLKHLHAVQFTIGYDTDGQSCLDHENEDWWCGECDQCIALMYPDEDFREEWIERKKDAQPRPPSLQVVEWRFVHLDLQVPSVEAILQELYEDND